MVHRSRSADKADFRAREARIQGVLGLSCPSATKERTFESEPKPLPAGPRKLKWGGDVAPQKWPNFYMKVLTKLVSGGDIKIRASTEATLKDAAADQQVEAIKSALRGLGLDDNVETDL